MMALTSSTDSGKTVVYTDRELSKPLLEYYGGLRDSTDMTRFTLDGGSCSWLGQFSVPTSVSARHIGGLRATVHEQCEHGAV